MLLYNKSEFAHLNLRVPATFSDLVSVCKAIKSAGKVPLVQSGGVVPTNAILAVELAANTVYSSDPNWNAQRIAGSTTFAKTAGWRTALQEIATLQSDGCFGADTQGVTEQQATTEFATGKALMWLPAAQDVGLVKSVNPHFPLGVAPVPSPTASSQVVMVAYPNNLVVNAHSSHTAAAEKFIAYIAGLSESRLWANAVGYTATQDAATGTLPPALAPLSSFYKARRTRLNPIFTWPSGEPFITLGTDVQGIFTGQKTPSAILSDVDNSWGSS
jgi:raffinose/stachyose/melibiose transport system substrate-binding protein